MVTEGGHADFFGLDLDDEGEDEVCVEVVEGGGEVDDDDVVNVIVPELTGIVMRALLD